MAQTTPAPALDEMVDLKARNKALARQVEFLTRQVEFLTWRLEQRERITQKDFEALQRHFENIKTKILTIFHTEISVTQGLTHPELQSIFAQKYSDSVTDLPRRVRELVEEKKLWRRDDDNGTARFYLTLKENDTGEGS